MKLVIRGLLNSLSINGSYRGYSLTISACEFLLEDETRLFSVTRDLYPLISKQCKCEENCIERNIRTVIYRAWYNSRERFIEIAGYNMKTPPTVKEFLGILISYLQRQEVA